MEVHRALKPGSLLRVHGLVTDKPLTNGKPSLPGPAALDERVPLAAEPLSMYPRLALPMSVWSRSVRARFHRGMELVLRELKLTATAPAR